MQDSVEYIGVWWVPENPENKIHGRLSYNPRERTVLSLDGAFNPEPRYGEDFYEIVQGDTSDGKRITLKDCFQTEKAVLHLSQRKKQYVTSEFAVSVFYVGCHFAKKEDIKFTRLYVRYSQLEEWLGKRPFHFEVSKSEEGLREHILKFTMPNVKEIILDKFKISIGYGISTCSDWRTPEFEAHAGIWVDVSDEIHIDEFFPIVYHIRNFLSLATGNQIKIIEINGRNKNISDYEPIQILSRREIFDELFSPHFFPFNFQSISKRPEFYFKNWFNLIDNLEPTYDLFFATVYNPYLYPTHSFLSLAQAVESYHSRTFDNKIMSDDLLEDIISQMLRILREIPENYQQQLVPKVRYDMNRKSFRKKLKELFAEYGNLFRLFIDDKDEFIGKVVDTRNYYTHYTPELEARAVKVIDLPFLSQDLRFILIVILLKKIGFDDEFTEQALRRYMRFRIRRIA